MIKTFHNPFDAQRPDNTGGLVNVIQKASSLHMIIFVLSRIDTVFLSACTPNESRLWATCILWAIFALIRRLGRHSSPFALACIMFLMAEMTLVPLGVITSLFNLI